MHTLVRQAEVGCTHARVVAHMFWCCCEAGGGCGQQASACTSAGDFSVEVGQVRFTDAARAGGVCKSTLLGRQGFADSSAGREHCVQDLPMSRVCEQYCAATHTCRAYVHHASGSGTSCCMYGEVTRLEAAPDYTAVTEAFSYDCEDYPIVADPSPASAGVHTVLTIRGVGLDEEDRIVLVDSTDSCGA